MIIRNKDVILPDNEVSEKALISCLKEHEDKIDRYLRLKAYYDGEHAILAREKKQKDQANNKLVVNHAEYITDFATAYFMGNAIKYSFPNEDEMIEDDKLLNALKKANITKIDTEISRDISIYGVGFELIYQDEEGNTKSANLSPTNAFVVIDDTVEEKTIMGVHRTIKRNEDNKEVGERVHVYLPNRKIEYEYTNGKIKLIGDYFSVFSNVPMIEYWNKVNRKGDFESVIPLIDAYNLLQSDRVNDKEQFVDAILVLYGTLAGDNIDEKLETVAALKQLGLLEMPSGDKVEYISKTFHEADVELLRQSVVGDIHKISKVPNLTDENFASNASGVAMRYKLLGLEQLAQTKEEYYRIGLKERFSIYADILGIKSIYIDINDIEMSFTRSLPVNETEIASLVAVLKNTVSDETLLSLLPFVENVEAELERIEKQKVESAAYQRSLFGGYDIEALPDEVEDEEEI